MKLWKKIAIGLLVLLVVIQFFRPARNASATILPTDITNVTSVPHDVQAVLTRSCYDCHSNNTVYPWYMNIQPVAWYLANHIKEGKRHLNFSDFGSYSHEQQVKKFKGISREVRSGGMPISSYTLVHTYAKLSDAEKTLVCNWADSLAKQ